MNILAFDASSDSLCVAIGKDSRPVAQFESTEGSRHSEFLVAHIDKVAKIAAIKLRDLGAIAVGVGPGSFTGLRVAVSCAQSLGYVLKTGLIPFSSLDAIAHNVAVTDLDIVVALDAKRSQIYAAVYRYEKNNLRCLKKPAIYPADQIPILGKKNALWTGSAIALYRDKIAASGKNYRIAGENDWRPRAAGVYACAFAAVQSKRFLAPQKLLPLYLHPKDCNVTRKK